MALALASLIGALILARRWQSAILIAWSTARLSSRWAPIVFGVATSLIMSWVWRSLRQPAVTNDGIAYLTQAKIFSTFHLYAAARPLPEFFEQFHVFVTPKFMAKYPPGQSVSLVPGVWLGLPALGPIVTAGAAGALTFALARRISNVWIALTTWLLWVTAAGVDWSMTTYLSQTAISALSLGGWYGLLRWHQENRRAWLLLVAFCAGWGLLTHPFTAVLFTIPTGVVVLVHASRRGRWKDVGLATVVGLAFVALLIGWSDATVGHGLTLPWSEYARIYSPWDKPGFGADSTPALRALPPIMADGAASFLDFHAKYTVGALPSQLLHRLLRIVGDVWGDWRIVFVPLSLLGLVALSAEFRFALAVGATVVGGFLLYAHRPQWTMYYLELFPLFAFAMALGIWRVSCLALDRTGTAHEKMRRLSSTQAATAVLLLNVALLPEYRSSVSAARESHTRLHAEVDDFREKVAALPGNQIIVFVKYDPQHEPPWSLVFNEPNLQKARAWQVYDRGADDIRLVRLAPRRVAYLYDQATDKFVALDTLSIHNLNGTEVVGGGLH
jgi:hypothetical protein